MKTGNLVKNNYLIAFIALSVYVFLVSCNTSEEPEVFAFNGTTMGTTYSVKVVNVNANEKYSDLKEQVDSVLIEVNKQMSTYINESELSQFNYSSDTTWFTVSADLAYLISKSIEISNESNNYYDVTIGPVVNLWGFGPTNNSIMIPSDEEIRKAKNITGVDKLHVDIKHSAIKKTIRNLYCDLSSIAKGFGVDKVGLQLENNGITNYMVEIGGEVRTKGMNVKKEDWKIGISTPLSDGLQKVIGISGVSVATSGDYLNFFEKDGKRFSHLINPRIGKPITHNLASVTVIDENCANADAYATAINVMGEEAGYEFAKIKKLPVFMIVRENNKFIEKMTPQFEEYIFEKE